MFSRFGTKYRWHSQENENIFDAFKCVLKDRYRDRMKATMMGCITTAPNAYRRLCGNVCVIIGPQRSGKRIQKSLSRIATPQILVGQQQDTLHQQELVGTAGSIGFDQHRRKLEKLMEAQEAYMHGLVNKFGEDPSNRKDDVDVWEESQLRRKGKKKGAIYGIGASDIHFLVLGTPSSQSTPSTQSDSTQQEVDRLRAQVSEQQQQMKEQMEMVMRMINMSGNQPPWSPDNPPEDN
ncbi:unnamed protein product [Lactuca virosa]|uniref:Uncharacterized protein n=1 Tax=Lactuca virosa TaxID=75947 RepID=A0AAU9LKR2_9ASTR|nr:unnamed protein product [Lactuca virosa]